MPAAQGVALREAILRQLMSETALDGPNTKFAAK
jgi:hypothetical protein